MSARAGLLAAALLAAPMCDAAAQVAVRGETVYTMAGEAIRDGVVIVRDGKIAEVGPASRVTIPQGFRVLTAKVVTPGLVDAHTVVGLAGASNQSDDQDQLDRTNPIQPDLRAYDAYNTRDVLVEHVRSLGVTTMHTGHGPGALISGQTMIVKPWGDELQAAMILDSTAMLAMTLGPDVSRNFSPRAPGSRAKGVAMVREQFVKAQEYRRKLEAAGSDASKRPARDLGLEVLVQAMRGEVPVLVTAQGASEILAALRLQKEFGLRLVLDGAADAHLVTEEIRQANIPVILHPTMVRPGGTTRNATMEAASILRRAGIPVALQSGFEGYVPKTRVVLFEAALAAANGLTAEQALATITIDAARILGVDGRVGSIERGKDGDLVLYDGDPFEYRTHVCAVVLNGEVVSERCR
jgi:imidazolonepropionase-like amidohydrolase